MKYTPIFMAIKIVCFFQQQDDLLEKLILSKKIELEHCFLYNWLDLDGFSEVSFES